MNNKSELRRISYELDESIKKAQEKVSSYLRKMNILREDETIEYTTASRMVALKFKQYEMPLTDEIIKEIIRITKGGKIKK